MVSIKDVFIDDFIGSKIFIIFIDFIAPIISIVFNVRFLLPKMLDLPVKFFLAYLYRRKHFNLVGAYPYIQSVLSLF